MGAERCGLGVYAVTLAIQDRHKVLVQRGDVVWNKGFNPRSGIVAARVVETGNVRYQVLSGRPWIGWIGWRGLVTAAIIRRHVSARTIVWVLVEVAVDLVDDLVLVILPVLVVARIVETVGRAVRAPKNSTILE